MVLAYPGCRKIIGEAFSRRNASEEATLILTSSLSKNTIAQYNTAYKKWWCFCCNKSTVCLYNPSTTNLLDFLTQEYKNGASYATLNTFRSAINLLLTTPIADDKLINKVLKDIFTWNP